MPEPAAWAYELATTFRGEGGNASYGGWVPRLSREKPNVPEGSIRNLTPLYSGTAPPAEEISDERLLSAIRSCFGSTRAARLIRTTWKDSLDIDEPSFEIRKFASLIQKGAL
jgi:hypothetical protein